MAFLGKQYNAELLEVDEWVTIPLENDLITIYIERIDACLMYFRINSSDDANGIKILEGETITHNGDVQIKLVDVNTREESSASYQVVDTVK